MGVIVVDVEKVLRDVCRGVDSAAVISRWVVARDNGPSFVVSESEVPEGRTRAKERRMPGGECASRKSASPSSGFRRN